MVLCKKSRQIVVRCECVTKPNKPESSPRTPSRRKPNHKTLAVTHGTSSQNPLSYLLFTAAHRNPKLSIAMRPLDEKETTLVFEKLFKFVGPNLKHIIERPAVEGPDPGGYCFRLHKNRVYYASESLVRRAISIARPKLVSLGLPIGKITKSGQFRLTIHSLDLLTAHARNKIWLKPAAEMTFLYGNSVTKSMLARITENTKAGDGVVVLSMSDLPLGFGVAARSTQDCRKADTNAVVVHHQADNGEYLRNEEEL